MKQKILQIAKEVFTQFEEDHCANHAAALAYTTILSIVPLATVLFGVLSSLPEFKNMINKIQAMIFDNLVPTSATTIQEYIHRFIEQTSKLSAVDISILLVFAVLLVFSMEKAFNIIWHIKKKRHGATAFIMYWGVLTLLPILLALGVTAGNFVASLPHLSTKILFVTPNQILAFIAPFIFTLIAITVLFVAMPNRKVPTKLAFYAAIPTTILFEIMKRVFVLYITYFPTYRVIYGALATVPIFLVWIYISWLITLLGAVLSRVLTKHAEEQEAELVKLKKSKQSKS